jgi:anti-anti-sigma factor
MDDYKPLALAVSRLSNGVFIVEASGECDLSEVARLDLSLRELAVPGGEVRLDLSAVTFFDSTSLQALMRSKRALEAMESSLVLVSPSPIVARILELSKLDGFFEVRDAHAEFAGAPR